MPFEGMNFGLARPTVQFENPMDVAMKGLAMQNAQQQVQQGGLQTQKLQKEIADQQELQDTLKAAKSPDEAMSKVQSLGTPTSQGWLQKYIEMKQKGVQLNLDQSKLANDHLSRVGGGLLSVANAPGATPQQVADYVNAQAQAGKIDPAAVKDTLSTLPTDPAALSSWSKLQAVKLGTAEHTLKLFTPKIDIKDMGGSQQAFNENPLTGEVTPGAVLGQKTLTPGEVQQGQLTKEGHAITMRGQNMTDARARETNATLKAASLNGLNGQELMAGVAQQNPNLAALITQAINGDLDTTSRNMKDGQLIASLAYRIDPNFDQHAYKLKQDALKDPAVVASSAALGHIGDFRSLLSQLDSQTQARILNTPLNKLTTTFTDSPQAGIISALQTTGLSLAEEYGKALKAGQNVAGDQKRENVFDVNKPVGQLTSNLQAVGHLLDKTIGAQENVLNRNRPNATPLNLLDPGAQKVLQDLGINHAPGNRVAHTAKGPGSTQADAIPVASETDYNALKSGTWYRAKDGSVGRKP